MKRNLIDVLSEELKIFVAPLVNTNSDLNSILAFYKSTGYDLQKIFLDPANTVAKDIAIIILGIHEIITELEPGTGKIRDIVEETWQIELPDTIGEAKVWVDKVKEEASVVEIIALIDKIKPAVEKSWKALQDLEKRKDDVLAIAKNTPIQDEIKRLPQRTLDALMLAYCLRRCPILIPFFKWVAVLKEEPPVEIKHPTTQEVVIIKHRIPEFQWKQFVTLINKPHTVFPAEYWSKGFEPIGTETHQEAINKIALKFFGRVQAILTAMNMQSLLGLPQTATGGGVLPDYESRMKGMLTAWYPIFDPVQNLDSHFGASVGMLTPQQPDGWPGIFVLPFGNIAYSTRMGAWNFDISSLLSPQGFKITQAAGIQPFGTGGSNQAKLDISLKVKPGLAQKWVVGSPQGTRLELSHPSFSVGLDAKDANIEAVAKVDWKENTIFLQPQPGNGFLKKVMPEKGVIIPFDLAIAWSNKKGFHFAGRAGLEIVKDFTGNEDAKFQIQRIKIKLSVDENALAVSSRVDAKLDLGRFLAVVTGVGVGLDWKYPTSSTSGKLDFKFLSPTGVGLSINSDGMSGGGKLTREENRYTGVLQLSFRGKVNFSAIGILDTKLPGTQGGYSLLLLISVDNFAPIALGFGFSLTGIGGLIALHRRMDTEVLQSGIYDETLDSLLFPPNPVKDESTIINVLDRAFPVAVDNFVFGPTAKIIWGTGKALLQIKLGLFIHITDKKGVVVALPGVITTLLPDEKSEILSIRANFLAVIRFTEGNAALDATLFDSRIGKFTLSGDMVLRISWKEQPNFLISVGGFNPRFTPPASLPSLRRLQISILDEDDAKVSMQCYFAVTSNSIQTGARMDAYFKAGDFQVVGWLGFDVLFQFNPFKFFIDFKATFAVKSGDKDLLAVTLVMNLEGPDPWRLYGYASFEILGVEISLQVDKTFGDTGKAVATLEDVKILELLKVEFGKTDNWQVLQSADKNNYIRLRPPATEGSGGKLLAPDGGVRIRQSAVPLKTVIQWIGNARPTYQKEWRISKVNIGTTNLLLTNDVLEYFPPAQFLDLTDDQKLSRPAFEQFPCGVEAISGNEIRFGTAEEALDSWEKITIYQNGRKSGIGSVTISKDRLNGLAMGGAVARARSQSLSPILSPRRKGLPNIKKILIN